MSDRDNHREIYLQPPGTAEAPDTGRLWCQDDAPFDCENDNGDVVPWVKYVRSDIHDAKCNEVERLQARLDTEQRVTAVIEGRLTQVQARLALSATDRGSLFARLCETEARLAEAGRDATRYRHLRNVPAGDDPILLVINACVKPYIAYVGEALDTAIDAARAATSAKDSTPPP